MDPREALDAGFSQWLSAVAGGRYVRQGQQLDPYTTSWRNSGRGVAWLKSIEAGNQPQTSDPGQNITDLRNAGLVEGGRGVQPTLTALGAAALTAWRQHQVDNSTDRDEVARAAALMRCGLDLAVPMYVSMFEFWNELLTLRPATDWFADVPGLYLASYLNSTSSGGYNPYRVLVALGHDFDSALPSWTQWANDPGSPPELQKFVRTVTDSANRPGGRRTFCQGMEAVRLTRTGTDNLPDIIAQWGLPA